MAITVLSDATTASDSRTLTWTIPTLATGDVVAVAAVTEDTSHTLNPPSGTGLTFTARVTATAANRTRVYIWSAVALSGGSSVAVTCSILAGAATIHNGICYVLPTADGYSLAATPNTATVTTGAASSVSLAGATGNLGIVALGDWNGGTGASRAWLASATEDMYIFSSSNTTHYAAHCTLTGATTSVGLSAPAGSFWTVGAMEVLQSGAAPAVPPALVMAPRWN